MFIDINLADVHESYRCILQRGLENLRRYSAPRCYQYLEFEIDHLHNIPSYMQDANLFRHACYYFDERELYLKRMPDLKQTWPDWPSGSIVHWYEERWTNLRRALIVYQRELRIRDPRHIF